MYTQIEAARRLGVDPKTLRKRMARHELPYDADPLDGRRRRLVSADALERLSALYGGAEAGAEAGGERLVWDALWEAIQGIERRLATLEMVWRPESPQGRPQGRPHTTLASDSARRREHSEPSASRAGDTFPAGWMAVSTFCDTHNIYRRSMDRPIARGEVPMPTQGEWRRGIYVIRQAWPAEQLAAVAGAAGRLWPERFRACARCPHEEPVADTPADEEGEA
jgi:hypothetical protein